MLPHLRDPPNVRPRDSPRPSRQASVAALAAGYERMGSARDIYRRLRVKAAVRGELDHGRPSDRRRGVRGCPGMSPSGAQQASELQGCGERSLQAACHRSGDRNAFSTLEWKPARVAVQGRTRVTLSFPATQSEREKRIVATPRNTAGGSAPASVGQTILLTGVVAAPSPSTETCHRTDPTGQGQCRSRSQLRSSG